MIKETMFDRLERMLTLEEFCSKYGYSKSSVQSNFNRTAASFEKKFGKKLTKNKKTQLYIIEDFDISLYKEMTELLNKNLLDEKNFRFFIIEGILNCFTGVFRGTKEEFLTEIGIEINEARLRQLDGILKYLKEKEYVKYNIDEDIFIIYPRDNAIGQIDLKEIVDNCKDIAEKNHNNKETYFHLIKCWIIMDFCFNGGYLSYKKVSDLTGLSENQIRNIKNLLLTNGSFQYSSVGLYLKNRKGRL